MLKYLLLLIVTWEAATGTEPAKEIRVLAWNLHHGQGEDGKLDLERIAKVITAQHADLVALQEVDNGCARTGKIDQPAELAKLTGMNKVFGKAMSFGGGEYGLAILSAHPIGKSKVIHLPGGGEPRIALEATVTIDGKPVRFASVHLDHQDATRRVAQVQTLLQEIPVDSTPSILAGDFNDVPGSDALKTIAAQWQGIPKNGTGLTCPARDPKMEIDHIFLRGLVAKGNAEVIPEAVASDHRPVLASVSWNP